MWPRNGRLMIPWIAGVLILILAALTGCGDVEVLDATPVVHTPDAFTSPLSGESEEHNLAVLAVDFDPPLDHNFQAIRLVVRDLSQPSEANDLDLSRGDTGDTGAPSQQQIGVLGRGQLRPNCYVTFRASTCVLDGHQ